MENLAVFMTWWVINFWRPSIYLWRIAVEEVLYSISIKKRGCEGKEGRRKEKGGKK